MRFKSFLNLSLIFFVFFTHLILPVVSSGDVEVLSHTGYIDSLGCYHVVGEILNIGDQAINFVYVNVTFYDSHGNVIDTRFDLTMLFVIMPGQKSPFDVAFLDAEQSSRVHEYSLEIKFSKTSPLPQGLEILSYDSYMDEGGRLHITGEIKNIADKRAHNVEVIATFYDSNGKVVAAISHDVDPEMPRLDPNETKSFEIILESDRARYTATYELTAESNEYTIIPELPIWALIIIILLTTLTMVSKNLMDRKHK